MQTNNINIYHQNNTTFGTKFGPNLTRYIEQGKNRLTEVQKKNINIIENNGFDDTTLDIVQDDLGNNIFQLSGKTIDKKNSILSDIFSSFFKGSKLITSFIQENNNFSIFKINKNDNGQQILNHFNTNYLNKSIIQEINLADRVTNEYDKFMKSRFS